MVAWEASGPTAHWIKVHHGPRQPFTSTLLPDQWARFWWINIQGLGQSVVTDRNSTLVRNGQTSALFLGSLYILGNFGWCQSNLKLVAGRRNPVWKSSSWNTAIMREWLCSELQAKSLHWWSWTTIWVHSQEVYDWLHRCEYIGEKYCSWHISKSRSSKF